VPRIASGCRRIAVADLVAFQTEPCWVGRGRSVNASPAHVLLADHAVQVRQDRFQIPQTGIQEPAMVDSALHCAGAFDDRNQRTGLVVFHHVNFGIDSEFAGGLKNLFRHSSPFALSWETENRGEPGIERDSSSILRNRLVSRSNFGQQHGYGTLYLMFPPPPPGLLDDDEDAQISAPAMPVVVSKTLKEFLEDVLPGRSVVVSDGFEQIPSRSAPLSSIRAQSLDLHCEDGRCGGVRTFDRAAGYDTIPVSSSPTPVYA
jgi:hypothetical protein